MSSTEVRRAPRSLCIGCKRSCTSTVGRRRFHHGCYNVYIARQRSHPTSHKKGAAAESLLVKKSFVEKGYAYAPGFGTAFATEFQQLMGDDLAASDTAGLTRTIGGGVLQYPMVTGDQPGAASSVFAKHLRSRYHELVMSLATYVGIDHAHYHIQDEKLLVAKLHQGEQALHFDREEDVGVMKSTYTVILYLTDHATSTAFPTFDQSELALPQYPNGNQNVPLNQEAMQTSYHNGLLNKDNYRSVRVRAGDMVIFNQALMHYGTACDTIHDRMALFCILTAQPESNQDEYQMFRWIYISHAFGPRSRELAVALYSDRDHSPLHHAVGKPPLESMIHCLLRWGVIKWQPRPKLLGRTRKNQRPTLNDCITWEVPSQHRSIEDPRSDAEITRLYGRKGLLGIKI